MTYAQAMSASEAVALNRRVLRDARVLAVTLYGGAGGGKTALLQETLQRLAGHCRAGVIIANPKAERDARQLARYADVIVPVRAATLDAERLQEVLSRTQLGGLEVLFIETLGSPTGSPSADLWQDAQVAVFSVSGGDNKAAEFAHGVAAADLVLLNKLDLLPHVQFDPHVFESDVRRLNIDVPVLHVSATRGTGMDQWERWLLERLRRVPRGPAAEWLEPPEVFLG